MRPLEIATAGPYNVFFLLAFVAGFAIAWQQGWRHGASPARWLALLALTGAAGLVGARLLHFDPGAATGAKTILGGVLLAALALFGGSRFLRLDPRSPDALALALPVGFAVGRIGCLLAGCCFGHPTDLPWGAIYDPQSAAFRAQLEAGLIDPGALEALPVHPTQLYEAFLALLVAGAIPRLRRVVLRPGSLVLAVLLSLSLGRLLLEFLRACEAGTVAGMTQVQWLIGVVACVIALLLFVRERRIPTALTPLSAPWMRLVLVASAAPVLLLAGGPLFSPLERLALSLIALPPLIALLGPVIHAATRREHALATPAVLPCALLLIALQQSPDSAMQTAHDPAAYPRAEWRFGLSAATGEDWETRVIGTGAGDCGLYDITDRYNLRYRVGGAALSYEKQTAPDRATTIRLRGFAGTERAAPDTSTALPVTTTTLGGAGGSVTLDFAWIGLTGGLAVGRFHSDSAAGPVAATAAIRVGRLDGLHAFAGVNDMEPLGNEENVMRVGAAYGFSSGSAIRAGIWRGDAPFLGATLAVSGFELEPSIAFSDEYDVRLSISRRLGTPQRR